MDPQTQFYNQIDLFFNEFSEGHSWTVRKDTKNHIVVLIPPEWLVSSQMTGVALQFALNARGELSLSLSVENPIPLQQRAEFKAGLYQLLAEKNAFETWLNGFHPNLTRRGKLVKKAIPLLADSYKDILDFVRHAQLYVPDIATKMKAYKDSGKIGDLSRLTERADDGKEGGDQERELSGGQSEHSITFDEGESNYQIDYNEGRKIFTQKAEPTVENLLKQVKRGKLSLQPDFQRQFVWDRDRASSLIESLLLEVPLPIVYLAEHSDDSLVVIDGQQRLSSIFSFIDGVFPDGKRFSLTGLKILKHLNQKPFTDIDDKYQDKIESAPLSVIIIKKESDPELKFEIFQRLNTGSVRLNDQELRNCLFRGRYLNILKDLSGNSDYQYVMGLKGPDKRMKDVEYVLRFAAFYHQTYLKFTYGSLSNFLNGEMKAFQNITDEQIEDLTSKFKKAVQINKSLFGNRSFRKIKTGDSTNPNATWKNTTVVNAALYDVLMVGLLDLDKNVIYRNLDAIREAVIYLVTEDEDFIDTIEKWTASSEAVRRKFAIFNTTVSEILRHDSPQNRCFSGNFKEQLFRLNRVCAICEQQIYSVEDAAVDHIEQYWLGGKTIPENARLAHRFCNAVRRRKE